MWPTSLPASAVSSTSPTSQRSLTQTVAHLQLFVGMFASASGEPSAAPAELTLTAYRVDHSQVGVAGPVTVAPGAGFRTPMSLQSQSADIASFELAARPSIDSNKQLGIDDISFGGTAGAVPDFTVTAVPSVIELAPGETASSALSLISSMVRTARSS